MLLLVINSHEKKALKKSTDEILTAHARYLLFALELKLCIRVTWKYTRF